ncbi:endonuclease/exonuclease/phosphatase family protein [Methylocystis parvus]|uniref:Endonuclease/exonuclease/phosphatase family protein n=1 Tax=Methylocystis parvus TaxID=134 RepID=A0A6B8MA83_9HYPH|nr:endonuclease/exonuclease/phosphatase family protein [Methylocystis parvus]QGM98662.1 endonuclease/exonuclease/phosphatase family protein [Methylocystis parvus]WBK00990.1 endonuclease/exonuclease/phosphatase family protein [Methylocystis parvus OBBP]
MTLRLATFNLENLDFAPSRRDAFEARRAALLPMFEALDADILCLQEVGAQKPHKHSARDFIALDRLLAGTPYAGFSRASSVRPGTGAPADVHNLVILSRWPICAARQIHHDIAPRWSWPPPRDGDVQPPPIVIEWDRPLLYAAIEPPSGRRLHVLDLHLRAPRPAPVATARGEGSSKSLIEGQFVAAQKREGQALEARLFVETLFDADPDALIAVCGDFNADDHDAPTRLLRGGDNELQQGARALAPMEERAEPGKRYSVIHAGRPKLIDHILASPALAAAWRETRILNEGLEDEVFARDPVPGSLHAAIIAAFEL